MKTSAGNLKKGEFVLYNGEICQVQKAEFYSPGKGSALMRSRIKNLVTGKNVDYTYKSNESVETVDVQSVEMQYLYKDADNINLMDSDYEQHVLSLEIVGDIVNYLKDGENVFVYMQGDKPLTLRPPASVRLKIVETEDAVKGDTVQGGKKPATLETGAVVQVPLFVKVGEVIIVNPETGEYVSRS